MHRITRPRRLRLAVALGAAFGMASLPSQAQESVPFLGDIVAACALFSPTQGALAPNAAGSVMSSGNPGGSPGGVSAVTNATGFSVTITSPTSFSTAPATGDSSATFTSTFSGTGATTIGATAEGTPAPLSEGITVLSVDLQANSTSSGGTFPSGSYATEVTITCE